VPCFSPLAGYRLGDGSIVFSERGDVVGRVDVPCGQCIGCRIAKADALATRLVCESWSHSVSFCATLTYADDFVPALGSLSRRHVVLFLKRLRERLWREHRLRIRFHVLGEYSPDAQRPHYHLSVFGWWPHDAVRRRSSRAGGALFESAMLSELWGMGYVNFQPMTPAAARYVGGYYSDKLTGQLGRDSLVVRDARGVVVGEREQSFQVGSRRPGLGALFFDRYGAQLMRDGFVVIDGKQKRLPEYFLRRAADVDPLAVSELRAQAALAAVAGAADRTVDRLAVREVVAKAKLRLRPRSGVEHA
jgi:hypothetical protein